MHPKTPYLLLLILVAGVLPLRTSHSCGLNSREIKGFSFVNPHIVNAQSAYAPYFLNFSEIAEQYALQGNPQVRENILEWKGRFCSFPDTLDIAFVLNEASVDELEGLLTAANSKGMTLGYRLAGNTFAESLVQNKCTETIRYLIFAKRCEPHCVAGDSWTTRTRDLAAMQALIDEGKQDFIQTKSFFIKLRYSYQIIRLAHYMQDYPQTIELFDYLMPKNDKRVKSVIYYWILGHKAGALRKLGQNAEAAYLYAQVFLNCPGKRESAFRSFYIKTDEEWEDAMNRCANDRERATLYALRGSADESKALTEMERIYELDPTHEMLDLLLVREVSRLEKIFLGANFNDPRRKQSQTRTDKAGAYMIQLLEFVRHCVDEGKVNSPGLWRVCAGYLQVLSGQWYEAQKTFEAAQPFVNDNAVLKEQLQVFRLVAQINAYQTTDDSIQNALYDLRSNDLYFSYKDFASLIEGKTAALYDQNGNKGMAFLTRYSLNDLALNPQPDLLDDLIAICQKPRLNRFEKSLLVKSSGQTMLNDLLDIKGTLLISQNHLEAASEVFKQIPPSVRQKHTYNPFRENIRECVHCNAVDSASYDKGELVEKLLDLQFQAKAALGNGAYYYYQLGLAFYNMTYFGNAWEAADFYRSGATWYHLQQGSVFPYRNTPFGNRENLDCSVAREYFEMARQMSKDPELAARAAFMAARCEQKQFFVSKDNRYRIGSRSMPVLPEQYLNYFGLLKTRYSKTAFYQELIKECKYFRMYCGK